MFRRRIEKAEVSSLGEAKTAEFFLQQDYDGTGKPVGYTQVLWCRVSGRVLAMSTYGWVDANADMTDFRDLTLGEAEAVLTLMKQARVTAPWVKLQPLGPGEQIVSRK